MISEAKPVFTAYMISRISLLALSALLTLPACGFQPMYGSRSNAVTTSGSAAENGLNQIEIANIKDEEGVYLRNALIDRLYHTGYPANARYLLTIGSIYETKASLDITTDSETTRAQLTEKVTLTLTDREKGTTPVLTRVLSSVSSYNILESEYATRASEHSARESALDDIARQAELQLTLFLNRTAETTTP